MIHNLKSHFYINRTEDLYEQMHTDIDIILAELNLTIESIRIRQFGGLRISSVVILDKSNHSNNENHQRSEIDEKKKEMADICRHFVNSSKNIISSSLISIDKLKSYLINGMEYLCLLVKDCLEITYLYSFKNYKLDERSLETFNETPSLLSQTSN